MPLHTEGNSPLLLTFLAEKFDKFSFYLSCGYSLDVPYKEITKITIIKEPEDDDLQAHATFYKAKPMFKGCTLRTVVEQMHPELLLDFN